MIKKWFNIIVREPLVLFAFFGGCLFLLYEWFGNDEFLPEDHVITVTSSMIDSQAKQWSAQMGRPAEESEIQGFIDKYIHDEILSREAKMLGLDEDDIVIKRRLVQKMEFMNKQFSRHSTPADSLLIAYYTDQLQNYQTDARVSFAQVFLRQADQKQDMVLKRAETLKESLNKNNIQPKEAAQQGDGSFLNYQHKDLDLEQMINLLGDTEISKSIWESPIEKWSGPYESAYGYHLVYLENLQPSATIDFGLVRDQVIEDYLDEQEKLAYKEMMEKLRSRYVIRIDESLKNFSYSKTDSSNAKVSLNE